MSVTYKVFTSLLIVCISLMSVKLVKADLIEDSMIPFWQTNTVIDESMLPVSYGGRIAESSFLFDPIEIIYVKNSSLDTTYVKGRDWIVENGKLYIPSGSKIPFLKDSDLNPPKVPTVEHPEYYPGDKYFHDYQISVSYKHNQVWNGLIPPYAGRNSLPKVTEKLANKKELKIVLYGDSISVGACSTEFVNLPPYLPVWSKLFVNKLEKTYGSRVTLINPSIGGKDSRWGADNVHNLVAVHSPDLVIIAFGMNDNPNNLSYFTDNLQKIIADIKNSNPNTEFILISPMLSNPDWNGSSQSLFINSLSTLVKTGIVLLDMSTVHSQLLEKKSYADMTGNNLNHPNDYLARWYAQQMMAVFTPPAMGWLDIADCSYISGWAGMQNNSNVNTNVAIYADKLTYVASTVANTKRDAGVCDALGIRPDQCNHGFVISTPESLKDGKTHTIDAYVINGTDNPKLINSSATAFACPVVKPADFNADGKIDLLDFGVWKVEYLAGRKTLIDFGVWKKAYLTN